MRPVYFPAILSPCYGLPLCNYILIPPELRAPRLFFFVPSSPLCHPRLISACGSSLFLFVIFINLRVLLFFSPPLSLSLFLLFFRYVIRVLSLEHWQASVTFASLWRQTAPFAPFGDIVTYPRLAASLCLAFLVARSSHGLNYDSEQIKRLALHLPAAGIRFASSLFRCPLHWPPLRHPYLITG